MFAPDRIDELRAAGAMGSRAATELERLYAELGRYKWVKTDERNPGDEQWVLGHYPGYPTELAYVPMQFFAKDAPDSYEFWKGDGECDRPDFWMPLPEAPK